MFHINSALFHTHDTTTNAKRAPPTQTSGVSKNVIIGIILGVIALVICAIIGLLLWRLAQLHRDERRRRAQQVDLLESPRVSIINQEDLEKGLSQTRRNEKPLPRPPSDASFRGFQNGARDLISGTALRYSVNQPTSEGPVIRTPPPAASNASIYPNPSIVSSSTLKHSGTATAPSLGMSTSHSRNHSYPFASENNSESDIQRGQFIVINVTESDVARFQRPQLVYGNPPEYTIVRGRDPPFPSKMERKPRPASITILEHPLGRGENGTPSTPVFPVEKRRYLDVPSTPDPPTPGTSYTVQVPPPPSRSTSAPPRMRLPLTITASRPMSNVVVENMRTIRRPNGTQGKGRMVTMSVLVEDSDPATSEVDSLENRRGSPGRSSTGRHDLDSLLDSYAYREGGLPPYTPRDEAMR